jgi:hypothetical protein
MLYTGNNKPTKGKTMAVLTQEEFKKIAAGASIADDSSLDVYRIHVSDLAVAALGDDIGEMRKLLDVYMFHMSELVGETDFNSSKARDAAYAYLYMLDELVARDEK